MNIKSFHYESIDSTNRIARDYLLSGGELPALFTADGQTAGRGRLGRSFYSPDSSGLYMSLVLPVERAQNEGVALTVAVSVAVARTLSPLTTKQISVKWVNDILADGKKAAGILLEAVGDAVIIGIGINLWTECFPGDIKDTATSLGIRKVDKKLLAEKISEEILKIKAESDDDIIAEYKRISAVLGKDIYYLKNSIRYDARALDVDEHGGLVVQNDDGTKATLQSGEITLRIKDELSN